MNCSINICDDPPDYELYSLQGIVPPIPALQPTTPPVITPEFGNVQTSCVSVCVDGGTYTYFVASNLFIASTQQEADVAAQTFACQRAEQLKVCLSSILILSCKDDAYSATITGPTSPTAWELVETETDPTTTGFDATGLTFTPSAVLPPTATIAGNPAGYGVFRFGVRAFDGSGNFADRPYSLWFAGITTTSLPIGTVGVAYSARLSERGLESRVVNSSGLLATPRFVVDSSTPLPAGLTLDSDGLLHGTPLGATAGTTVQINYGFYAVTDDPDTLIVICETPLVIVIQAAATIETETMTKACQGIAYNQAVSHPSIPVPTTWAFSTDDATEIAEKAAFQATGLDLITAAGPTFGHITGTAIIGSGTNGISVTLKYDNGGTPVKHRITLAIFEITTTSLPQAIVGTPYGNQQLNTIGQGVVVWSIAVGSLPSGLTLDAGSGVISGTPITGATTQTFTVQATQGAFVCTKQLTIQVGAIITTASLPNGGVGNNYNAALSASGISNPSWSYVSGTMPPNTFVNPSGSIFSGGVLQIGSGGQYTFTIQASNGTTSVQKEFTMYVVEITSPSTLSAAIKGQAYSQDVGHLPGAGETITDNGPDLFSSLGLSVNAGTGKITGTVGTPSKAGYSVSLKATLGAGTTIRPYTLAAAGVTAPTSMQTHANQYFRIDLTSIGITNPVWTLLSGDQTKGFSFNTPSGGLGYRIDGSPIPAAIPGPYVYQLRVTGTLSATGAAVSINHSISISVTF